MANKVPKFTVSQKKSSRNAFDLSQTHLIQAAPGQLLPILSLDLIPEDDITINVVDFIKSMPIVSSPFSNAKGVYEFFFVPYHQLWHNFDQFITQMNDYRSTYFNRTNPPSSIPAFDRVTEGDSKPFEMSPFRFQKRLFASVRDVFDHPAMPLTSYIYDLLGYGPFCTESSNWSNYSARSNCPDYQVNLFRLCAYQKIYQDYYRKTSYEPFDVSSYCLDNLSWEQRTSFLQPRYRNYGLDLLNNLRPSASLNVNNQNVFEHIIPQMFGTDTNLNLSDGAVIESSSDYVGTPLGSNDKHGVAVGSKPTSVSSLSALNVNSIRAAFALDKLSQLMGRAEKDFKSQMQAVYGVNVSTGRDGKCIFIDGFSSDIQFSDVDNTNGDSFGSKFSQYGKVASSGNGSIHFKSPEFGVLMCIYSIIPFVPYDSYHVDRFNTKHVYSDYFNPIYQRLGLQPLFMYELNTNYDATEVNPMILALGWQPRYSEYKTAVDFNHGSFNSDNSLSSFSTSRNRNLSPSGKADYLGTLTLRDFKINPNVFDSCFSVNYDGSLLTAPFFGKFSFNIVKVSSMDTDSLPLI